MANTPRVGFTSKRLFLLLSLIFALSVNSASGLRYNRSLLKDADNPEPTIEDEFTGDTYMSSSDDNDETVDEKTPGSLLESDKGLVTPPDDESEPTEEAVGASFLQSDGYLTAPDDNAEPSFLEVADRTEDAKDDTAEDSTEYNDADMSDDEEDGNTEDFLDRSVGSSLLETAQTNIPRSNLKGTTDDKAFEAKNLNDNKLKAYLKKIGAIDRMKEARAKGKQAASAVGSKLRMVPSGIRKVKKRIIPDNPHFSSVPYDKPEKVPHGRRLLDTMNDVDEKRRQRGSSRVTGNGRNSMGHGSRLANTMRSVDERKLLHIGKDNKAAKLYDDSEKENREQKEPVFDKYAENRKKYLKENRFRDKNRRFTTTYDA